MDEVSSDVADIGPGSARSEKSANDRLRDAADLAYNPPDFDARAATPDAGISRRQKLLYHGSGIGVGLLIAAIAFTGWRYFAHDTAATTPSTTLQQTQSADNAPSGANDNAVDASGSILATENAPRASHPRAHHAKANAGADVIAAAKPASGLMYVHRNNSDLRPAPSTSSEPIKKLAKGEKVQLLALSDKWAEVDDAGTKGWVRASVIKDTPPDEKKSRKKKSDSE